MCGFTGFLDQSAASLANEDIIQRMMDALTHRGPDDKGFWSDDYSGITLGHRRLSILDLSPAGHQPMVSVTGRYTIAFNGEIYNHLQIRDQLSQTEWRGHSDTETLLAAIEEWGIGNTLKELVGMFGFALWDRQDKTLYLARDRVGEKPVYYGWQSDTLVFGSELKALRQHPKFHAPIDRNALCLFMRYSYIPAPHTIYQDIKKLSPGTFIAFSPRGQKDPTPVQYWSFSDAARRGIEQPFAGSDEEAINTLDRHLSTAIQGQMLSDVPLGAFLSGGIDSSLVVATMQRLSKTPIKTFTIGFNEAEYNEAEHAKSVARHLGTDHTELYVTAQQSLDVIPRLPQLYDEPFADSSQIPTFLVSQLAKTQVSVCLSGDGGDELFGGYNRYAWSMHFWNRMRHAPVGMRNALATTLTVIPPSSWDSIFRAFKPLLPKSLRYSSPGDKIHKLSTVLGAKCPEDIFFSLLSHWKEPERLVLGGHEPATALSDPFFSSWIKDKPNAMMLLDSISYLPDDILVKVDRAAMAVSLETRVPLLDHRFIEFAWSLPPRHKLRGNETKWILKQLLSRHIPQELIDRPKMGFGVPIDQWLRGPLRDWAETLLAPERLRQEGYLSPKLVRDKWVEHLSGQRNWAYYLWDVLMFQAWLEESQR